MGMLSISHKKLYIHVPGKYTYRSIVFDWPFFDNKKEEDKTSISRTNIFLYIHLENVITEYLMGRKTVNQTSGLHQGHVLKATWGRRFVC